MRAEIMMKEYKNMKAELSILIFQLGNFKGINKDDLIISMSFSHPTGERVQTSTISDKTGKIATSYERIMERENDEWFDFLWKRYQSINEEVRFFEHIISELNGVLPAVVMDLLDEKISWESMMSKYNVSHAMIGKYRKTAIQELNKKYELRDRQTEAYILS